MLSIVEDDTLVQTDIAADADKMTATSTPNLPAADTAATTTATAATGDELMK